MIEPLVSIIIPLYNAEKYIGQTIQSSLDQIWPNKEIIIVNDGSTDGSLAIARSFASETVKVFSQENQGASSARNKGLSEAKGDYIQFLDADDLLSPDKILEQMNALYNRKDVLAISDTVYFFDGKCLENEPRVSEWYSSNHDDPVDFLIKLYGGALIGEGYGGMITVHSWLTPRELITKAGNWNVRLSTDDDGEFFCRVILKSSGIVYAPAVLNYYRKFNTSNSLSSQATRKSQASILLSTDLKAKHLLSRTNSPNARLALARLYYDNAFAFYPRYPDLAKEAQSKAKDLSPDYDFDPFESKSGLPAFLAKLVGWKGIRYLQYIKNYKF